MLININEKRDAENHCIISDKGHLANVSISWRAIRYSSSRIHDILFHRKYHFQIPETYLAKFVVPCKDIKPMKPKIKPRHTLSIFSQHSKVAGCFCLGAMPNFFQHTCNSWAFRKIYFDICLWPRIKLCLLWRHSMIVTCHFFFTIMEP